MTISREKIAGGLYGMLVGDALGVPYEFTAPEHLPPREMLEMDPPPGFDRAHASVAPGTWSDDGAQALCLLASLLEHGRLDAPDFAARLLAWYRDGYMAIDSRVFDVGVQTQLAFRVLEAGAAPLDAGPSEERHNGNGSLMRVLPLALWHQGSDADLVTDAHVQSAVTHGHLRAQVCCALYCLWARRSLAGVADPWAEAVAALRAIFSAGSPARAELDDVIRPDAPPAGSGSGYVVDCLNSARLALAAGSYERTVKAAIALGNDTDTTACVAGGIAGVQQGLGAIPARWRDALRGKEIVQPLVDQLLHRLS